MNNPIFLPNTHFSQVGGRIDTDELEQLANQHPYCSLIQFYLLNSLKNQNGKQIAQASKTALFFKNPQWLEMQLDKLDQTILSWKDEILKPKEPEQINKKILPENEPLPFEPLHLVDYFASQGISITPDNSGDKLGKQLKSFTDWLKTMKKIHSEKLEPGSELTDQKIQMIAEGSNNNAEVVTEAMAEVLEMQGKNAKAIELYSKLSLLNPAKSATFAAKIESLKGS